MSGGLVRAVGRGVWIWFDKDLLSVILSLPVENQVVARNSDS